MPFTGKSTFAAGADLPEIAEDVSDIIGIVSPFETPLLDLLGDPRRVARSTVHEWLEDALLPNADTIDDTTFSPSPTTATTFSVANASRFRVGDQIRVRGSAEVMLVTGVAAPDITVVRGYGGTIAEALADGQTIVILGNAALEGADAAPARFTNRVRKQNFTQILSATVQVSGSQMAVDAIGVADELDYQKQERLRELLRDLENCVINGVAPASNPQGGVDTRRTMNGLLALIQTNRFQPGVGDIPPGKGVDQNELTDDVLNAAFRLVWEQSSARIDTILCGAAQKRLINEFTDNYRTFESTETTWRDSINVVDTDFGSARVVVSRWVPHDTILLLDSSRIQVLPLAGRSFHFKPLASNGDSQTGQVLGEYTLELHNENAHAVLTGLAA